MQAIGPRLAATFFDRNVAIVDSLFVHPLPATALFSGQQWPVKRHDSFWPRSCLVRLPALCERFRYEARHEKKSDHASADRFHRRSPRLLRRQAKHGGIPVATRKLETPADAYPDRGQSISRPCPRAKCFCPRGKSAAPNASLCPSLRLFRACAASDVNLLLVLARKFVPTLLGRNPDELENSEDCGSAGGHGNQHVRLRGASIDASKRFARLRRSSPRAGQAISWLLSHRTSQPRLTEGRHRQSKARRGRRHHARVWFDSLRTCRPTP